MYHSSTYAELTDQQWEEMRKEILESNAKKGDDLLNEDELLQVM
jgi:hypothetical protein